MRIEVIVLEEATTTEKGDLLESLAAELLGAQSYRVRQKVRLTACELDLLCEHTVSGKEIYVECKAHKDKVSANHLTNLLGTITLKDYAEGWLVVTSPPGKDATGFMVEWEKKPREERTKLSFYTPELIVGALQNAGIVSPPPSAAAVGIVESENNLGEWTLLVSPWGKYWASPCLEGGIPVGLVIFDAKNGKRVTDTTLLAKLLQTDTTLAELPFDYKLTPTSRHPERSDEMAVVEVEYGESWADYRPARPEHFVGRTKVQRAVLQFLAAVKKRSTDGRVFAIKGDSGMGKSSLIAKLRERVNKSKKPGNLFMYAVDVRAASSPGYVYAALLSALKAAGAAGFGGTEDRRLRLTNYADPLQSESIRSYLEDCAHCNQLIVLVYDQFEELYSKPDLLPIFDEARRLMFSAVSAGANLVLGFAWKTDSTVPQEHPAYHMWHQLSDHRYEVSLGPFTHADAVNSVRLFEKELHHRIRPELSKYLIESSQGFPWLLKKLCIHLYEQLESGLSQTELAERSLDIRALFDRDLQLLSPPQDACLKFIAKNAPVDWYEVLEVAGANVVTSLQDSRLVIRRGDKLNLYWDIFREYVLTSAIPHIPFTHVSQSPSIAAFLRVAGQLDGAEPQSIEALSAACDVSASTVRNIVHDLSVFGVAVEESDAVRLDPHIEDGSTQAILGRVRMVLRRHALTQLLREQQRATPLSQDVLVSYLKELSPAAKHHSRTWLTYANRMGQWLTAAGYLRPTREGWVYDDTGEVRPAEFDKALRRRGVRRPLLFIGDAPPSRVIEALTYFRQHGDQPIEQMKSMGFRNACAVLYRFSLVEVTPAHKYRVPESIQAQGPPPVAIWNAAKSDSTLSSVVAFLKENPTASADATGRHVATIWDKRWTPSTARRVGNALRQWGTWLLAGEGKDDIPPPPGRVANEMKQARAMPTLFPKPK